MGRSFPFAKDSVSIFQALTTGLVGNGQGKRRGKEEYKGDDEEYEDVKEMIERRG